MQIAPFLIIAVALFASPAVSEPTATATWTRFHSYGTYVDLKGTTYTPGVVPPDNWPVGAPSNMLTWNVAGNITFVCGAASTLSNDEIPRRYCASFNSTAQAFVWYDPYSLPIGRSDALCWYHKQTNSIWFSGGLNTYLSDVSRYTLYRANITANGTALNAWELMQGAETEDAILPNATFPGGSGLGLPTWTDAAGNFYVWGEIDPNLWYFYIAHPPIWKLNPLTLTWTRYFETRRLTHDPVAGPIGQFGPNYSPRMRVLTAWTQSRSGLVWFYGGAFAYPENRYMHAGDLWALNVTSMEWAYMGGPLVNYTGQQYSDGGTPRMYSPLGTFHPQNSPGARAKARLAEDDNGNIWLMGGAHGYYSTVVFADLCVFTASTTRQWACVPYPYFNTANARESVSTDDDNVVWPCAQRAALWFPGSFNGSSGFFLLQGNGHSSRGDSQVVPQAWSLADGWFVETKIIDQPSASPAPTADQGFHVDIYANSNLDQVLWSQDLRWTSISIDWSNGSPFSPSVPVGDLRYFYRGFIMSPYNQDTNFGWIVLSDDGAAFTLYSSSSSSTVGDTSPHSPEERYNTFVMRPGANRFLLEHFDGPDFGHVALSFRPPGDVRRRTIPAEWFSLTGIGPAPLYNPEPNPMSEGMMLEQFWNSTCTGIPTRVRHWNSSGLDFLWTSFQNPMWNPIYTRPKSCFRYTMWVNFTSNSTPVGFVITVRNGAVKVILNNQIAAQYSRGDASGSIPTDATNKYTPNIPNKLVVEITTNGDVDFQGRTDEARVEYTLGIDSFLLTPSVARTYNWAPPPEAPPSLPPVIPPVSAAPIVEAPVIASGTPTSAAQPTSTAPVRSPSAIAPDASNIQQAGLGTGPIVGIIVAIIVAVIVGILILLFVIRRRRNRRAQAPSAAEDASAQPLEPSHYGAVSLSADQIENEDGGKKKGGKKGKPKKVDSDWDSSSSDGELKPEIAEEEAIIRRGLKKEWVIPWKELDVIGRLGHGSFGVVMKAEYGGAEVAMKQCALTLDRSQLEQFKAESILVLSLKRHPNIVSVLGICIHRGSLYLLMELCELGSLDGYMSENELSAKNKLKIAEGVALGIRHLHNNNVIHRDIACRNVLLSEGMKAKVSDFGMSRLVDMFEKKGSTNTNVGPIRFMAPESLASGNEFSEKSDVWMFCCFLVELWTGATPHADKNLIDVGRLIRDTGLHPDLPADMDPVMRRVCEMGFQFDPANRPTMDEICRIFKKRDIPAETAPDADAAQEQASSSSVMHNTEPAPAYSEGREEEDGDDGDRDEDGGEVNESGEVKEDDADE